ncbi:Nephrocystin-3 [Stylophora pistillata]|uniref:Nephrocystin-3 n=2 Tax=Stylophora pistillata TaxID=50429 RepID=A0A2B4SDS1_STYPI|nr:Nephrocystin-3 [Stylophora pistillata]
MDSPIYTKEQLNYFRVCHIATNILPQELRLFFKKQWDSHYQATLGEWKDTPRNGSDFYNNEPPHSRTQNARLLKTVKEGRGAEWDCTTLFFAILYSDSIGKGLDEKAKWYVDDLRELRNEKFAHMPWGRLSELEFKLAAHRVKVAFQSLGLSTEQVLEISRQKIFQTEEIESLKKKSHDLHKELEETKAELEKLEKDHQLCEKQLEMAEERLEILEEQRGALEDQLKDVVSPFFILPPKPNHEIATRDGEVAEVIEELDQLKKANEDRLSYLYITGNPGSGKSQLAGLVAEKFYKKDISEISSPSFVMTLNAESLQTLLESYVTLVRQVKCPEYDVGNTRRSKETSITEKIKNLKDLITTKLHLYASWLLVVDNATNVSDTLKLIPQSGNEQWSQGQVLITTQDTLSIPPTCSFISHFSISQGMKPIEARRFLANIAGFEDRKMEDEVAKALDYQPLALASAGNYVRKTRECNLAANFGWKEYLEKLENGMRALTEEVLTKTNPAYSKSMTVATRLAVERAIDSDSIVQHSFSLLSLCAPQALHLDILKNYILNVDEHVDKDVVAIHVQGYSLLLFEERENGVFISMHRVVWDAIRTVRSNEEPQGYTQIIHAAVRSFNEFVEIRSLDTWHDIDSIANTKHLIAHFKALAKKVEHVFGFEEECPTFREGVLNALDWSSCFLRFGIICENHCELSFAERYYYTALKLVEPISDTIANSARIYQRLGSLRRSKGDLKKAIEYFERSITIYVEKLGPENINVATSHRNLGDALLELVDLKQASKHFKLALNIYKKTYGTDHVHVASISYNLGIAQHKMGNLRQALTHFHHAVAIYGKTCGPDPVDVAHAYLNLGIVQVELGNLQQAMVSLNRAIDIFKTELGGEHVDVAQTYLSLGTVQREFGNLQQAKEYLDLALNIFKTESGSKHVNIAQTYRELGIVQRELGNLQQAKEWLDLSLENFMTELGTEHVDVAQTYLSQGIVQRESGNLDQAKEYFDRALNIFETELGTEHVKVAQTYLDLGIVQREFGNLQQAKKHLYDALDIFETELGTEHASVAQTFQNIATLHYELGDLRLAKEFYSRAQDIFKKRLGPDHVEVAICYENLGKLQRAMPQGDLLYAKELCIKALQIKLKSLGTEHIAVARTCDNLSDLLCDMRDLEQAKQNYERSLGIYKRRLGPDHVDVARTNQNLGKVHYELGDLQQAQEHYKRALGIYEKRHGSDHIDVAVTNQKLGKIAYEFGDLQQASEHLKRALDIYTVKLGQDCVEVASSCSNLGDVCRAGSDLTLAKELYERALTIDKEKFGPEHAETVH